MQDGTVCIFDTRVGNKQCFRKSIEREVASVAFGATGTSTIFYSDGSSVAQADLRKWDDEAAVFHHQYNQDDVSCIHVNERGTHVLFGDDAGEVSVASSTDGVESRTHQWYSAYFGAHST